MPTVPSCPSATSQPERLVSEVAVSDGEQRLRGYVKSYCPFKGIGFIKCETFGSVGSRDIMFDREEAEKGQVTTGATVSFALKKGERGQRAENIKVLIQGFGLKERVAKLVGKDIDWKATYVGIIRTLWHGGKDSIFSVPSLQNKDPGGAFIVSGDAHKVFKLDIWAYPSKLGAFKVGDVVKFKVEIDSFWSYPCAYDVRAAEPALQDAVRTNLAQKIDALKAESRKTVALPKHLCSVNAPTDDVVAFFESLRLPSKNSAELACAGEFSDTETVASSAEVVPGLVAALTPTRSAAIDCETPDKSNDSQSICESPEKSTDDWTHQVMDAHIARRVLRWLPKDAPSDVRHYFADLATTSSDSRGTH